MPRGIYKHKTNQGFQKGRTPWNKGKKGVQPSSRKGKKLGKNPEHSERMKGRIPWSKGKTFSAEYRKRISDAHKGKQTGENHYRWIKDRTEALRKHQLRTSFEYKLWRGDVFERDKYTCKECGAVGVYLEAHHIIPIRSDKNKIFDINNGITLCHPCHIKTMWKESSFAEKYSALVVAQTN